MRTLAGLFLVIILGASLGSATAQAVGLQGSAAPIDVVDVEGPLDRFLVDFVIDAIADAADGGSQAVILKIDSSAALVDLDELFAEVENAPLPVVAWVGDAPAVAFGGALELAARAHLTIAAPSVELGYGTPVVLGVESPAGVDIAEPIEVVEPIPGLVDDLQAALGPLIVSLDGVAVEAGGTSHVLTTAEEIIDDDGEVRLRVVPEVRFQEPGLFARFMRLPLLPEATFFFLVAGLTLAAFEFYAIGPGVAAGTAAVPLLLAGYGLVVLPLGWGLLVTLAALWLLTADFQRGGFGVLSYLATALLIVGGLFITDSRPQLPPSWWAVTLSALGVALFYMFAMPTVARSRFTTPTIGREYLVGKRGLATSDVAPDGGVEVEVDGARWHAVAHREAGIHAGDEVVVEGIRGLFLDVAPPNEDPKSE